MRSPLFPVILLVLASIMVLAESDSQPSSQAVPSEPTVQSLLDRMQRLEKRISDLEERERQRAAAQTLSSPPANAALPQAKQPVASSAPDVHEHATNPTLVQQAEVHYPSLQIRGFGDVDFSATDQKGSLSGFNLGQFVLHVASPLSKKVSYFGEVSFTAQPTAYEVQVERNIIRYDYNDYLKISFGKYHTPIGYWNTAFHHGAWLQTTISRPQMVQFGGTLIPVHFVGLLAEGNLPSGGLGLGYSVGVGNGRSSILSKSGDNGDVNDNRAWVATVFARPTRFYGLQFGGSVYRDRLTPQPDQGFNETISSAHLVWTKEHPEFLSEVANVHHRDVLSGKTYNTQAFYIQLAYRLPWQDNKWKPYLRFERIHTPQSDPVFSAVSDLVGSTLGVRYDITNYAAFKGEYRHSDIGIAEPAINGAFFQTAFTF
jgi:hypothetical protein